MVGLWDSYLPTQCSQEEIRTLHSQGNLSIEINIQLIEYVSSAKAVESFLCQQNLRLSTQLVEYLNIDKLVGPDRSLVLRLLV